MTDLKYGFKALAAGLLCTLGASFTSGCGSEAQKTSVLPAVKSDAFKLSSGVDKGKEQELRRLCQDYASLYNKAIKGAKARVKPGDVSSNLYILSLTQPTDEHYWFVLFKEMIEQGASKDYISDRLKDQEILASVGLEIQDKNDLQKLTKNLVCVIGEYGKLNSTTTYLISPLSRSRQSATLKPRCIHMNEPFYI